MDDAKRLWTVPNLLTVLRLLLLGPILFFLARGRTGPALACIFLGFTSDFIDGWIARRFRQSSDFGRMLDPLADKLNILAVGFLMVLSPRYDFPLWYFVFLLVRELSVLALGLWVVRKRKAVPEANRAGKMSAFFTGVCVLLYILGWQPYASACLWAAFALSLRSTWIYYRAFRGAVTGPAGNAGR